MPVSGGFFDDFRSIFAFQQLGCSVIPLIGGNDIELGKRAALPWSVYQKRIPSLSELRNWFMDKVRSAYGVVCGQVSRLIVLDLDDSSLAARFMRRFSHLLDTLIVQSGVRSTPHIYWRVDFPVCSRMFPGGDLKGDGGYVVGPGSSIGDHSWRVIADDPIRALSPEEFATVLTFLHVKDSENSQAEIISTDLSHKSEVDFINLYHYFCDQYQSRNQALFRVGCLMRDHRFSQEAVMGTLAGLHAMQSARVNQRQESYSTRYAEALRTISSVFSRPARIKSVSDQNDTDKNVSRLPNSVREALLAQPDGIAAARLLDAARIIRLPENTILTEAQICSSLKGMMCRETVRKALAVSLDDGEALFRIFPPENPPAEADTDVTKIRQKNAFLSGGQKQTRLFYRIPDVLTLCEKLQVSMTGGDALSLEDVSNARRYRQALHQALIQRRPGYYSQRLLAGRVNVSKRTIRRYNRQLGVQAQPSYEETPIMWSNLMQVPTGADIHRHAIRTGGRFLLDDRGKRWPLKREIAEYLLRQKRRVSQIIQGVNYYWCAATTSSDAEEAHISANPLTATAPVGMPTFSVSIQQTEKSVVNFQLGCPEIAPEAASIRSNRDSRVVEQKMTAKPRSKRYFHNALPDAAAEQLAQQVVSTTGNMSVYNARRLVETFGYQAVKSTVRKLTWLKRQNHVANPAGFMVTAARVSWLNQVQFQSGEPAPKFEAEPRGRERGSTYVPPQSDPLWQSDAYQEWRSAFFGLDNHLPLAVEAEILY